MAEYIEREAVENAVLRYSNGDVIKQELFLLTDLMGDITAIPAADVQQANRGKWDIKDVVKILASGKTLDGFCQCENCGSVYPLHYAEYAYCPNCGAKMGGDDNE